MARDYAKKSSHGRKVRRTQPILGLWILLFMLISLFILRLWYLVRQEQHANHSHQQWVHKSKKVLPKQKPQFEFYHSLTQSDDTQKVELKPKFSNKTQAIALDKAPSHEYVLQVASFSRYQDADNLRAELILQGYNANVRSFTSHGIKWNRVQIGPYKHMAMVNKDQQRLAKHHYKTMLLSVH